MRVDDGNETTPYRIPLTIPGALVALPSNYSSNKIAAPQLATAYNLYALVNSILHLRIEHNNSMHFDQQR